MLDKVTQGQYFLQPLTPSPLLFHQSSIIANLIHLFIYPSLGNWYLIYVTLLIFSYDVYTFMALPRS